MKTNKNFFESFDKTLIYYKLYDKVENPKACVLILHGMVEHSKRYETFAKFLNKNGIVVLTFDLRAHGKTVQDAEKVGHYESDLFGDCIRDAGLFCDFLKEKYPYVPLVVLGHSYGSFVLQSFVENYQNFDMAIFVGSANMKGILPGLALSIAKITCTFKGKDAKAKMINNLTMNSYAKNFEDGNWLTRDNKIFENYKQDEFCGNICSANFYVSMFKGIKGIYKKSNLLKVPKTKPFLILSGSCDPVGGNGKLVLKLEKLYQKLGVKTVEMKLYDGARHEILNETNKQEVFDDVLNFVEKHIKENKKSVVKKRKEFYDQALKE